MIELDQLAPNYTHNAHKAAAKQEQAGGFGGLAIGDTLKTRVRVGPKMRTRVSATVSKCKPRHACRCNNVNSVEYLKTA